MGRVPQQSDGFVVTAATVTSLAAKWLPRSGCGVRQPGGIHIENGAMRAGMRIMRPPNAGPPRLEVASARICDQPSRAPGAVTELSGASA